MTIAPTDRVHFRLVDFAALAQLAADATLGVTDIVEAMHAGIVQPLDRGGEAAAKRTRGISGLVYASVRGVTRAVGAATAAAARWLPEARERSRSVSREAALAALNGVLGDHLLASGNPLAIPMTLRHDGMPLALDAASLATALPRAGGRVAVLVHGLCLGDLQWRRGDRDYGAMLARAHGYTPIHLHYNSGLHVSTNGRAFAYLLEALARAWPYPLESLAIVGHSMGGLVARSACHVGERDGHAWRRHLRVLACLGTPHHGAWLERGGHGLQALLGRVPYAAPLARLGRMRSAAITDLRHGNLLDADWQRGDRFADGADTRTPLPLPAGVRCCAAAAVVARRRDDRAARTFGDGLVPLPSALGEHADPARHLRFPTAQTWVGRGMRHMDLLGDARVAARLREWLAP